MCRVRIPGVCNHDPETTVLAHIRMQTVTGVASKSPDLLGAWCCSACHDLVDGRTKHEHFDWEYIQLMLFEGVIRTQYQLIKDGIVTWEGPEPGTQGSETRTSGK